MSATGVLLWYSAALSLSGESRSRQQPSLAPAASSNRDAQNRGSLITSFDVSEIIDITPGISQVLPSSFYSFLCWGLVQMLSSEFEPLAVPVSIWKAVSECWDSCETVLRQLSEGGERVCVCVWEQWWAPRLCIHHTGIWSNFCSQSISTSVFLGWTELKCFII